MDGRVKVAIEKAEDGLDGMREALERLTTERDYWIESAKSWRAKFEYERARAKS